MKKFSKSKLTKKERAKFKKELQEKFDLGLYIRGNNVNLNKIDINSFNK